MQNLENINININADVSEETVFAHSLCPIVQSRVVDCKSEGFIVVVAVLRIQACFYLIVLGNLVSIGLYPTYTFAPLYALL